MWVLFNESILSTVAVLSCPGPGGFEPVYCELESASQSRPAVAEDSFFFFWRTVHQVQTEFFLKKIHPGGISATTCFLSSLPRGEKIGFKTSQAPSPKIWVQPFFVGANPLLLELVVPLIKIQNFVIFFPAALSIFHCDNTKRRVYTSYDKKFTSAQYQRLICSHPCQGIGSFYKSFCFFKHIVSKVQRSLRFLVL